MWNKINQEEIYKVINNINKPILFNRRDIPYRDLGDREFEILTYYLFEAVKIKKAKEYDAIDLMSGVGERGRDCVLYKDSRIVGVVQCKHSQKENKMDKPTCAKEIIKFVLNIINDDELVSDKNNINYYLVHSEGFFEPAQTLLNMFNREIVNDKNNLKKWTKEVIDKNRKINLKYDEIENELISILQTLKVKKVERVDLDKMILNNKDILDMFFTIEKVVFVEPELPRDYEERYLSNEDLNKYNSNRFINEIKKIKLNKKNIIDAIQDYWRTNETLVLLTKQDYFDPEIIEKYSDDLKGVYELEYDNACEDIEAEESKKDICKKSRKFYRNIMNIDPKNILKIRNNRPFFQKGFYQDLINSQQIETWMLKPYEEGDDYEEKFDFS